MNLIALRGFKNNAKEAIVFAGDPPEGTHEDAVIKGQEFTVGGDAPYENLPNRFKRVVDELKFAKCIGSGDDEKLVAKIGKELAAEKAQREEQSKLQAAGSTAQIAATVAQVLVEYGLSPAKAKKAVDVTA